MAADARTALTDAAEHAVWSRGFDGFSYVDLVDVDGIPKASTPLPFPTTKD